MVSTSGLGVGTLSVDACVAVVVNTGEAVEFTAGCGVGLQPASAATSTNNPIAALNVSKWLDDFSGGNDSLDLYGFPNVTRQMPGCSSARKELFPVILIQVLPG